MSTQINHSADRLVDAFLDEGPLQMSDRLFAAIVDDVYTTRQRSQPAPWRSPSMKRSALAAAMIVVVIAVVGAAVVITRPNQSDVATQPSPNPATPAPAVGPRLPSPGSYLAADTFTEPFTFTMPAFPDDKTGPITGESIDFTGGGDGQVKNKLLRLSSSMWGAVTFHDDESLPADICRPSGRRIRDIPEDPAAVGHWLRSGGNVVVSPTVTMTVDGRPARLWDVVLSTVCDTEAPDVPPPWFGAGERHRVYAVPTGEDTILVITWGVDRGNGSERYIDEVDAATDELVRSMKFGATGGS